MSALALLRLGGPHWRVLLAGLSFAILGVMLVSARADSRHWRAEAVRYEGLWRAEQAAHQATVSNYRRAAELARAEDAAHAAKVERDQAQVSQEVSHDYAEKIAGLRHRYDALRLHDAGNTAAAADPGAGRGEDLPGAAQGAGGADAPAGEEGLSLDDRLLCSAQAEQLDALIDWQERVEKVAR